MCHTFTLNSLKLNNLVFIKYSLPSLSKQTFWSSSSDCQYNSGVSNSNCSEGHMRTKSTQNSVYLVGHPPAAGQAGLFLLNSLPFSSPLLSGILGSSWTKNCLSVST